MTSFRKMALERAYKHKPINIDYELKKASELFGVNVFNESRLREYLSTDLYKQLEEIKETGGMIDSNLANEVVSAMKTWALSRGATHYTHWFQPLTEATAEKHDAFLNFTKENIKAIERFEGNQLIQQEPDASSFPSGGIRNTFEARGYTAWDPSSPEFIIGNTLCIPTIFITYTGSSMDYKTPLLKANGLIDKAAVEICQYFEKNITKVNVTLGCEQEYFLVDEALFFARPDLVMTGRTVFGHIPAKGQQLEDHYFGSIPARVMEFMKELEMESWKLGIPVKTRHNEVAPNQFELAPLFEEVNLANDHNQLIMDLMDNIGRKHNFKVLFHEKPFAGVNGSGKHNNWSLITNTGKNLLSPGKTPKTNLQFLTFFINIIKAVYDYSDLLRASIASAGNDYRLGANEAPPAIISIFIGDYMTKLMKELESKVGNERMSVEQKNELKLNIGRIPEIILDNTDRNRTSPFAFTGNKFEFRAVGSSANCASSLIVLNTIVANQLIEFKKELNINMMSGMDKDEAILKILRKYIVSSKAVLFEGNGYSEEWIEEAKKRGLSNIKTTPSALKAYINELSKSLFIKNGIFTEREIVARYHIEQENYYKKIQIESRIIGDWATNHILPTAIKYQNMLMKNYIGLKEVFIGERDFESRCTTQLLTLREISEHICHIRSFVKEMVDERKQANKIVDESEKAVYYCEKVKPFFEKIRYSVDKLELLIDNEKWTLPKYREIFFIR